MGQSETKQSFIADNKQWKQVQPDGKSIFHNVNPYAKRTLLNTTTNEFVEEYQLQFTSEQDYKSYIQELETHRQNFNNEHTPNSNFKHSPYIYKVKEIINISSEDFCSTQHRALLYAQKVDLRLKEINDIPFSDQLYLTKATLEGFKILYQNIGYFNICQEMIFISKRGQVRVWINPNLANHQPYYVPQSTEGQNMHGSQSQMIVNLINLIEENTDLQANQTTHFKTFLLNKGNFQRLSFYKALEEFDDYCRQNRIIVPECMVSIRQLYYEDDSHSFASRAQHSQVMRVQVNPISNIPLSQQRIMGRQPSPGATKQNPLLYGSQQSPKSFYSNGSLHNIMERSIKHQQRLMSNDKVTPAFRSTHSKIPPLSLDKNQKHTIIIPPRKNGLQPNTLINYVHPIMNNYQSLNSSPMKLIPQSYMADNRKNSLKDIRKGFNRPDPFQQVSIKFNYASNTSSNIGTPFGITRVGQLAAPPPPYQLQVTSKPSQTIYDTKKSGYSSQSKSTQKASNINYYSTNQIYSLDQEIAEDLHKFLGFDPNMN